MLGPMFTRWRYPLLLAAPGVLLLDAGFVWFVVSGVAIPYQDPTPAMMAYDHLDRRISERITFAGLVALLLSAPFAIVLGLLRARHSRHLINGCLRCGYDLRGRTGTACPSAGSVSWTRPLRRVRWSDRGSRLHRRGGARGGSGVGRATDR